MLIFFLYILSKFFESLSSYILFSLTLNTSLSIVLFLYHLWSSIIYFVNLRPLTNDKNLSYKLWLSVLRYSFLAIIRDYLWLISLTLCGPLRAILLFHLDETVMLSVLAILWRCGAFNSSRCHGTVYLMGGILVMLLFDRDNRSSLDHPEGDHSNYFIHIVYQILTYLRVDNNHILGIFVLLIALLFQTFLKSISNNLSIKIGGVKKLQCFSSLISLAIHLPIIFLQILSNGFPKISYLAVFSLLFTQIYHFFVAIRAQRLIDLSSYVWFGWLVSALAALFISSFGHLANHELFYSIPSHGITFGLILGIILMGFGVYLLSLSHNRNLDMNGNEMLPFYRSQLQVRPIRLIDSLRSNFMKIIESKDSRRIFFYLCINLGFTIVEFIYGFITNSLSLFSDGFHMLFDSSALLIGLWASLLVRLKPTRIYPFSLIRVELLSGFINGVFLVIIASIIFIEALLRLLDPPTVLTYRLLIVSVIGLLVNLIGVFSLHAHHSHNHSHNHPHNDSHSHAHSHYDLHSSEVSRVNMISTCTHLEAIINVENDKIYCSDHNQQGHEQFTKECLEHSHIDFHDYHLNSRNQIHNDDNENMHGVFLHVLADTLGSIGVIISSLLIEYFGWYWSDPLCSLFISLLILLSVKSLITNSFSYLSLSFPDSMNFQYILTQLSNLNGCQKVSYLRIWQHTPNCIHAAIRIQAITLVDEQILRTESVDIFHSLGINNLSIQIDTESFKLKFVNSNYYNKFSSYEQYVNEGSFVTV